MAKKKSKTKKPVKKTKKNKKLFNLKVSERRIHERRQVLDTFHVFLASPALGDRKIYLRDVSINGFGFHCDSTVQLKRGQKIMFHFHLNARLFLPLQTRVAHVELGSAGCEILPASKKPHEIYKQFIALLDSLAKYVS